jgi:hypothetical protein
MAPTSQPPPGTTSSPKTTSRGLRGVIIGERGSPPGSDSALRQRSGPPARTPAEAPADARARERRARGYRPGVTKSRPCTAAWARLAKQQRLRPARACAGEDRLMRARAAHHVNRVRRQFFAEGDCRQRPAHRFQFVTPAKPVAPRRVRVRPRERRPSASCGRVRLLPRAPAAAWESSA